MFVSFHWQSSAFLFKLLCLSSFALAADKSPVRRAASAVAYYNPYDDRGSMLTTILGTYPPGQQEPLNMIISGNSDEAVLALQQTDGGLLNYFLSLSFAGECLGLHEGDSQQANLGDGKGLLNQTAVMRYDYGDSSVGTCTETVQGGNHFRYWVQNGTGANSGAIFMAASYEEPEAEGHDIVVNGYNLGRDYIIGNITGSVIPTLTLTNASTFSGSTSYGNYTYQTSVMYASGLLQNTSIGINHNLTVWVEGVTNAVDGLVAVLDVSISERPANSSSGSSQTQSTSSPQNTQGSAGWRLHPELWALTTTLICLLLSVAL
ncbi:uncharacterized protein BT62DRAFT_932698 [Guyanagaster necrorhizus]|uniref:Uncharacterized protein n=1 Tax=Guyanagaster necrorhizus TaxID=856835 RepID=A0A9P7VS33_9AGAR|nr:uncharacterized protein BT62DRAFT_932698 [Guyanagaster necrorhizus MCA 3950]KAG7445572.1 hypothetical protein BT62DRAFT_932698 [Guyanagaster necrorhizus MCA 3950]